MYKIIVLTLISVLLCLVFLHEKKSELSKSYKKDTINFSKLNLIESNSILEKKKNLLYEIIWGQASLPDRIKPAKVIENTNYDLRGFASKNLKSVDKYFVKMEYGIESVVFYFNPINTNDRLIIYHQGHSGGVDLGHDTISFFINKGFSVLGLAMPFSGENSQPVLSIPNIGKVNLNNHEVLKFVSPQEGSQLKFFISPVLASLNYLLEKKKFKDVSMIGLSGGGWATTLYSALDHRIKYSFPVAGSFPILLRMNSAADWGDLEQTMPELYLKVNYIQLYFLGSFGKGRKQTQILNYEDPCCFAGKRYVNYEDTVNNSFLKKSGGEFKVVIDKTHKEHLISDFARQEILKTLIAN